MLYDSKYFESVHFSKYCIETYFQLYLEQDHGVNLEQNCLPFYKIKSACGYISSFGESPLLPQKEVFL